MSNNNSRPDILSGLTVTDEKQRAELGRFLLGILKLPYPTSTTEDDVATSRAARDAAEEATKKVERELSDMREVHDKVLKEAADLLRAMRGGSEALHKLLATDGAADEENKEATPAATQAPTVSPLTEAVLQAGMEWIKALDDGVGSNAQYEASKDAQSKLERALRALYNKPAASVPAALNGAVACAAPEAAKEPADDLSVYQGGWD